MFVVTVHFTLEDGMQDDFLPLMYENARDSLALEPECHQFDVCTDPDQPHIVFLYELYTDAAAFEIHMTMPHFLNFSQATQNLVRQKEVNTYVLAKASE